MCAALYVSSWAESVRSVPVLNLSMLRVSILEICQRVQLLKTIWGLFLLSTSTIPSCTPARPGLQPDPTSSTHALCTATRTKPVSVQIEEHAGRILLPISP
ncbi:hypothetical protein CgunFtcFv8_008163 [Champsocephalus gunnari]|uniref:Uncharacterized protein n=1 Tax=Champsocephalus gunnari TaxID=52237 RepID=A0AAN8D8T6_CHAGU|nr:hypothetical protein CgunFtcFv8_008163 [Champsocephalus gunnari]